MSGVICSTFLSDERTSLEENPAFQVYSVLKDFGCSVFLGVIFETESFDPQRRG